HRDRSGADVGRVGPTPIARDDHHVGLRLLRRNGADSLLQLGIQHVDGMVEFGRDIEHAVGTELYPMRPHRTEIDVAYDTLLVQVDDLHRAPVRSWLSNPRVPIAGQIGTAPARRGSP